MTRDRRFLVENYDPLGAVGYWRRGELGLRSWAASLRRVDEVAWLARDDLRPFGLMCARMAWRGLSRRFSAGHSSAGQSNARVRPRCCAPRAGLVTVPGPWAAWDIQTSLDIPDITEFNAQGERDERHHRCGHRGAGPYGLSVAAHLRRSGQSVRHFGLPMHLWRANMPRARS